MLTPFQPQTFALIALLMFQWDRSFLPATKNTDSILLPPCTAHPWFAFAHSRNPTLIHQPIHFKRNLAQLFHFILLRFQEIADHNKSVLIHIRSRIIIVQHDRLRFESLIKTNNIRLIFHHKSMSRCQFVVVFGLPSDLERGSIVQLCIKILHHKLEPAQVRNEPPVFLV